MPRSKAEKAAKTASMRANPGGEMGYKTAALRYANSGIAKLNLKPSEKDAVRKAVYTKVVNTMGAERGRTASRAKGIVNRQAKARVNKAKNI